MTTSWFTPRRDMWRHNSNREPRSMSSFGVNYSTDYNWSDHRHSHTSSFEDIITWSFTLRHSRGRGVREYLRSLKVIIKKLASHSYLSNITIISKSAWKCNASNFRTNQTSGIHDCPRYRIFTFLSLTLDWLFALLIKLCVAGWLAWHTKRNNNWWSMATTNICKATRSARL